MKLSIIECDTLYPALAEEYISYGHMFKDYFSAFIPHLTVEYFHVQKGELPEPEASEVYLITGSKAGVYEPLSWIEPLKQWIQQAVNAESLLLGICFGHQILAEALGGKVENSHKGWGVGVRELTLEKPVEGKSTLSLIYSHQDQVITVPGNARILLSDDFCPNAGFAINDQVIGFQGHPEFTPEYTRKLYAYRENCIGEKFNKALATLDNATDEKWLGEKISHWMTTKELLL